MTRATGTGTSPREGVLETPDVFHVARDAEYDRLVREEAAYWDQPQPFGVDARTPETAPYQNRRLTGDANRAWFETIADYGPFRRGLALGTSGLKLEATILRQNPQLHLTFCDISRASLSARDEQLGQEFPGRVETLEVDLNFVELPPDSFDLIVSASSIHHIANVEHIAYQANRALTANGCFFLQDYVGESRFDFSGEKRRIYEAALAQQIARHPELAGWYIDWPQPENHSPFEAVRSSEVLDILRSYLQEERLTSAAALLMMLLLLRHDGSGIVRHRTDESWLRRLQSRMNRKRRHTPGDRARMIRTMAPDLLLIDEILCDSGLLLPSNAFGIYRKRQ